MANISHIYSIINYINSVFFESNSKKSIVIFDNRPLTTSATAKGTERIYSRRTAKNGLETITELKFVSYKACPPYKRSVFYHSSDFWIVF